MLFFVLLVLEIISTVVVSASNIRQTSEGTKTLEKLSKAGLFFLKWRAYANYQRDLKGLRKIFGALALISMFLLIMIGGEDNKGYFGVLPGVFVLLWMSLEIATNRNESIKTQKQLALFFVVSPWLALLADSLVAQSNILQLFNLSFLSVENFEPYQVAIILSLLFAFVSLFIAFFSLSLFSIVSLFFLFLIVFSSKMSKFALGISVNTIKNIAWLYICIGPVLMWLVR